MYIYESYVNIKCWEQFSKLLLISQSIFSNFVQNAHSEFLNSAPCHEGTLGEWKYKSTHSWPHH